MGNDQSKVEREENERKMRETQERAMNDLADQQLKLRLFEAQEKVRAEGEKEAFSRFELKYGAQQKARIEREKQEQALRDELRSKNEANERALRELEEYKAQRLREDQQKEEAARRALLEKEWRLFERGGDFTEDYANRLRSDIEANVVELSEVRNINILLAGPIKAGKSSLVNTIASIDKGRMAQVTLAGGAGKSMTKKLKPFRPKHRLKNFKIFDTMGVEEGDLRGLNVKDVMYVVNGHVPANYKFNPASPIDKNTDGFKEKPKIGERIHCVVFVVDANVVGNENLSEATKQKIKALQDELEEAEIPRIIILTQIDVLCEKVETDITNTYLSAKVKNAMDVAKELFNMPEQNIFPVQNYSNEPETDFQKEILALLALRQMLRFATDFLDELCDEEEDEQEDSL